jgi:hypothetical protein
MKKLIGICLSTFLFSCEKRELPVPAYERGDLSTVQIEMGNDYRHQVWFSLHENKIVSSNLKTDWDLAFESVPEGGRIFLNGSKAMKVHKTNYFHLLEVKDTVGIGVGHADMPSGNRDSTAIGDWKSNNRVYVINRGYSLSGQLLGFLKLKIISENADYYTFAYAEINSAEVKQGFVYKNNAYYSAAYSFDSETEVTIEPKKTEYNLCFTQYTHLFYDPLQYYQVTGALLNQGSRVMKIEDKKFSEISLSDTAFYRWEKRRDAIGYDWKSFDLNTNLYSVNSGLSYLIQDSRGFYYKLHFIDFVNSSGLKGYPKFEFKKL